MSLSYPVPAIRIGLPAVAILLAGMTLAIPSHALALSSPEARTLLLQTTNSWLPGERIRVTSPGPTQVRFAGWYSSVESDSVLRVLLSRSEPPVPVHLRQIGMLETHAGSKRHVWTGAVLGCLVGTLVGAAIAEAHEDPTVRIDGLGTFRMRGLRQTYVVIGAGSGLILGGAIGYVIRTDRWGFAARFD